MSIAFTSRTLSSLFALVMLALLSACGGGGSGSSSATTPVTVASPTLLLSGSTATVSGTSTSTLSATLKDGAGNAVVGAVVTFKTAGTNFGVFVPVGGTALTGANGVATITLNAGTQSGADSVTATATVNGVAVTSNAFGFTASGTTNTSVVASVSLSASQTSVASDNSNTTTLTAIVVDASNAAVANVPVSFSADTGLLTVSSAITDSSGRAQVTFSSGTSNATSRTGTISATTSGKSAQIPIRISGATITLSATSVSLVAGSSATLTAVVKSASGAFLANQTVSFGTSSSAITIAPTTATTDASGTATAIITAVSSGTVVVTATALGEMRTIGLTISGASLAFQITAPAASTTPLAATIGTPVAVTVQVPAPTTSVTFVTTLGTWTASGSSVYTTPVINGTATALLSSPSAGVANVQVFDTARQATINDTRVITFTASCTSAYKVTLQSTPSVVAPSSGGTSNLATLVATVTDQANNPVGGCPVAFRILNPTGGGETVSPAVALTAATAVTTSALGQATTTFTAGSLPSSTSGVQIRATVVQAANVVPIVATGTSPPSGQDATVIIGGTAGSVTIGRATVISADPTNTIYTLPMSVLVADSNGNPVANSVVSLSAWPIAFNANGTACTPLTINDYFNEDDATSFTLGLSSPYYENLILDPNEDGVRRHYPDGSPATLPGTQDQQLTPPNSAAGTLPATVTTNSSGVALFNLTYTKSNALWITDRITARTVVQGTETKGQVIFRLPALLSDIGPPCLLPDSPYRF